MAESLKIKLKIADRIYPMTIEPGQEEGLRRAAKKINAVVKKFEENYAVRDKQDLLAMSALQFAAEVEQQSIEGRDQKSRAEEKLTALNELLEENL